MLVGKMIEMKVKKWIESNFENVQVVLVGHTPLDHSGIDALLIINNIIRTMQIKSSSNALTEKDTRTLIKYQRNVDIVFYDTTDQSQIEKIESVSKTYNLQVVSYDEFRKLYNTNKFNAPKRREPHVRSMINRVMSGMKIHYTNEYIIKLEKDITDAYIKKNKIKIYDDNNDNDNNNNNIDNDVKIKIDYNKKKKEDNNDNNNTKKNKQKIEGYKIVNVREGMYKIEEDYAYLNDIDIMFELKTEFNNLYNKIMSGKYRGKNRLIVALILKNGYDKIGITMNNKSIKHKDLNKLLNIIEIILKLTKKYPDVDIDVITGGSNG